MTETERQRARFSQFELDLQSGELWDGTGRRVLLPKQPLRTLAALLRAEGKIVTREELRRELWSDDTFVDYEHSINAAVKRLREAIGDSATAPHFIETIPRVGYRFMVPAAFVERPGPPAPGTRRLATAGILLTTAVVAIATGFIWSGRFGAQGLPGRTLVRLTSSSGLNIDPAFSPDGSLLAYASDRAGSAGLDIWLQPANGQTPRRLTTGPGDELEPAFSPDGRLVAFAKGITGGICVVGAVGGEPRLLVEGPRAHTPRFSPDGRLVTYWTGQPPWATSSVTTGTGSLFVVDAAGGQPRPVASSFSQARYGTWSPDGTKLLFLGEPEREAAESLLDWYVVPVVGGDPVRTGALKALQQAGITGVPMPGGWSGEDDTVIFGTDEGGASDVWELRISPESGRVLGEPRRLTFGTAVERSPAPASSGRVVFTSVVENVDVWRLPLDRRTGDAAGALERVTDDSATDMVMSVSADGHLVAFLSSRTGRDELWLRDLSTGRDLQVTSSNPRASHAARLRGDGALIAVNRGPAFDAGADLLRTAGGAASPLCDDCQPVDWSPDGQRLLIRRGDPARLYIREIASQQERELARHPSWSLLQGRFSPDGRWVAFHTMNTPSLRQVYAVPTFTERRVSPDSWIPVVADFGMHPAWAPDGSGIYHFSSRDGMFCLWLQPVDPTTKRPVGEPRPIHHFHNPRLRAGTGAVAPSYLAAGHLYVTLTESTANIWLLNRR
jgi:Tol biopolymer transport system component/DNA-binding winged helix-turn-helix (wHTH) protein